MGVDPNQGASASAISTASSSSSACVPTANVRNRKRKLRHSFSVPQKEYEGDDYDFDTEDPPVRRKKSKAKRDRGDVEVEERRLRKYETIPSIVDLLVKKIRTDMLPLLPYPRRFRAKAPTNFAAVYERATTQRFYVLSRIMCGTADCPEMFLEITGSTGNVYQVCIARQPTCNCPHARAGNQCKHTLFVLNKVLRAKYEYVYQLALLSSELREIFARAPSPIDNAAAGDKDQRRKAVDGDCPICFEAMESGQGKEALVWCKAACGQNIHQQCFDMWATTKRQSGGVGVRKVPCPYCRTDWEGDGDAIDVANVKRGKPNTDGYDNVADQLGISTQRDYSTYSRFWYGHPERYGRRDRRRW